MYLIMCTSTPDSREEARRALALQLLPLLKGGRSELFGAARGGAIEALIDHYDVDTLKVQDLLLGYVLAPQREELGLSSDEMDKFIENSPILHYGETLRARYLAFLCETLAYHVKPANVHKNLFPTTDLSLAERRAITRIWQQFRNPPDNKILKLLNYLYGSGSEFRILPLPENEEMRTVARAFRYDEESRDLHRLVFHERKDSVEQIAEFCANARPGTLDVSRCQQVMDLRIAFKESADESDVLSFILSKLEQESTEQVEKVQTKKRKVDSKEERGQVKKQKQKQSRKKRLQPNFGQLSSIRFWSTAVKYTCEEPELTSMVQVPYTFPTDAEHPQVTICLQHKPFIDPSDISRQSLHVAMQKFTQAMHIVHDKIDTRGANILPSWSPNANWYGYYISKCIFINLALSPCTLGNYINLIIHELAHHHVGPSHSHDAIFRACEDALTAQVFDGILS